MSMVMASFSKLEICLNLDKMIEAKLQRQLLFKIFFILLVTVRVCINNYNSSSKWCHNKNKNNANCKIKPSSKSRLHP